MPGARIWSRGRYTTAWKDTEQIFFKNGSAEALLLTTSQNHKQKTDLDGNKIKETQKFSNERVLETVGILGRWTGLAECQEQAGRKEIQESEI